MGPKISVVIPTIEEESVFALIRSIRKLLAGAEIIVVDKSGEAYYRRLKGTGAVVIRQKDRGVENAVMQGLRHAHGDILASVDGDATHDISGIADGVRLVERGRADLVLGSRMRHLQNGSMDGYLRFGNSLLSKMFSVLYKARVDDVLTGLFVVRREAFDSIRNVDPYRAGIAFFAIELARRGYRVSQVDIRYYKRQYGESKLTRSKLAYGINVASHLARQLRDYSPLLVFGGIGVIVIIIGLAIGIGVILQYLSSGTFTLTGRALLAFLMVVVGFLFFVAGLILDVLIEIEKKLMKM